jgi:hypothetical protein
MIAKGYIQLYMFFCCQFYHNEAFLILLLHNIDIFDS